LVWVGVEDSSEVPRQGRVFGYGKIPAHTYGLCVRAAGRWLAFALQPV